MRRHIYKENGLSVLRHLLVPVLFTSGILVMILLGLNETERSSREEGRRILEDSIWRATITCYSIEGSYPPSISHIVNVYGVNIVKSSYSVFYDIVAQNMVPNITVLDIKSGGG